MCWKGFRTSRNDLIMEADYQWKQIIMDWLTLPQSLKDIVLRMIHHYDKSQIELK